VSDRARPRPTRAALAVGALIGAVALAGCGAGQVAGTSEQVAAVEGAGAEAGQIAVRNATIEFDSPVEGAAIYPEGGTAPLMMAIVNTGTEMDRLVGARSPIASSVQISGDLRIPGGQVLTVEGAPAPVAPPPPAEGASEATPGATAEPTPEATAEPAPGDTAEATGAAPLPIDEGRPGLANIVLTGLTEDIQAGRNYPVVLTFERAGEVNFEIPVASPDVLREDAGH